MTTTDINWATVSDNELDLLTRHGKTAEVCQEAEAEVGRRKQTTTEILGSGVIPKKILAEWHAVLGAGKGVRRD